MYFLSKLSSCIFICLLAITYTEAKDVFHCYDFQNKLAAQFGEVSRSFYWFPKCHSGGYWENVQCNLYSCYCAFVDTGGQIPNTVENALLTYMKENCPVKSKNAKPCDPIAVNFPCKYNTERYYYNPTTGKCNASDKSCQGFGTMKECEQTCKVMKKTRCNFKPQKGRQCDRRKPGERWYHDDTQKKCRPFYYEGCGGNSNNYQEKWQCLKTCEVGDQTEIVIQVEDVKYIVTLPTWIIVQLNLVPYANNKISLIKFKQLEHDMVEIAKFPVKEREGSVTPTPKPNIKRPPHADKDSTVEEICAMPKKTGPCRGYFPRWFFDGTASKCKQFIFGGCFANANNFKTSIHCAKFCNAEIPPTEAERIKDLIATGSTEVPTEPPTEEPDHEEEVDAGKRSFGGGNTAKETSATIDFIIE